MGSQNTTEKPLNSSYTRMLNKNELNEVDYNNISLIKITKAVRLFIFKP